MIRLERVFFSELNSQVKNREISWARDTDAVKSTLLCESVGLIIVTENNIMVKLSVVCELNLPVKGDLFKPHWNAWMQDRSTSVSLTVMF